MNDRFQTYTANTYLSVYTDKSNEQTQGVDFKSGLGRIFLSVIISLDFGLPIRN